MSGAVGSYHRAQLAYRRGKQVRCGGEARALDGMEKRISKLLPDVRSEIRYASKSSVQTH